MTRTQEARDNLRATLNRSFTRKAWQDAEGLEAIVRAAEMLIDAKLSESAAGRREPALSKTETAEGNGEPGGGEARADRLLAEWAARRPYPTPEDRQAALRALIVATLSEARDAGRKETNEQLARSRALYRHEATKRLELEAELAAAKGRIEELEARLSAAVSSDPSTR